MMTRRTVLVAGPDGVGKSTFVDLVQAGALSVERIHSHPHVLLRKSEVGSNLPVNDPHSRPARGFLTSVIKVGVVYAEWIAYWTKRKVRPSSKTLIIERGWYDQAVDPRRYRLKASTRRMILLMGSLLPRVDEVMLLVGDPYDVHERKHELSPGEIARQIEAWRQLATRAGKRVTESEDVYEAAQIFLESQSR
jgi:hypothetical protein